MEHLKEMTRLINMGRCWAVVGAGASCDMGLPSWELLARRIHAQVTELGVEHDSDTYLRFIAEDRFPELFSLAEHDLGGLSELLQLVNKELTPRRARGDIYSYLSMWPFRGYLTTSFDDHLKEHLDDTGVSFKVLANSEADFRKLRNDTPRVVVKLHGSLDDPSNVVLTSTQYADFRSSPSREYFRRKLGAIFEMADVVVVGYSLRDPDIAFIIEQAHHFASPQHPIYMIAADVDAAEARELYRTKNIRVASYPNSDGTHSALVQRTLPLMNRFIAPRVVGEPPEEIRSPEEDDTAASLYIYTQSRLRAHDGDFTDRALEALILRQLSRNGSQELQTVAGLISSLPIPNPPEALRERAQEIVSRLEEQRYIKLNAQRVLQLTDEGQRMAVENQGQAELLRDQVAGQIRLDFVREFPKSAEHEVTSFVEVAMQGLHVAMRRRGLSVAACVFAGATANLHEGLDIFDFLREASNQLGKFEYRAFFIEYLAGVIEKPSELFARYLAGLSQGHFAFHALGLHQAASRLRRDWLTSTVWILDSSVVLPLLAKNCYGYPYALDLFERIRDLEVPVFTTRNLFEEVVEHLKWAMTCINKYGTDSTEFMMIALLRGAYKQNLFIDGFIRSAANHPALTFEMYIESIFGKDATDDLGAAVEQVVSAFNVETRRFSEWEGFRAIDWGDRPHWTEKIREDRIERDTYRRQSQCEAEAEVLILLLGEREGLFEALDEGPSRAYFVSQSGVLRRVFPGSDCPVWSPEALYRYLLLFRTEEPWDDLAVYEAIRSDLFLSGISVIDEHSYARYFNPLINEANLRIQEAKELFRAGEASYLDSLSEFYDEVPELEKPFYALQVAWDIAKRERERADRVEVSAPLADKERQELEQLRIDKAFRKKRAKHKRRSIEQRKARENKSDKRE